MASLNKYGLKRDIPDHVKREVRSRCGFGCVICGGAIYEYDHFEPEFSEAKKHDPAGIILLCGSCHRKKGKGLLSKETVLKAAISPKCKERGLAKEKFDINDEFIKIILGPLTVFKPRTIFRIMNETILVVLPPEVPGSPYRINAKMSDNNGNIIFEIFENEWMVPSQVWDVEQVGTSVIVRSNKGKIALKVRFDPPKQLFIEEFDMAWRNIDVRFKAKSDAMKINIGNKIIFLPGKGEFYGPDVVFDVVSPDSVTMSGQVASAIIRGGSGKEPFISIGNPLKNQLCQCKSNIMHAKCCGKL